uniref:Creatinase N-terminal domain-containing protein n=1 Tax=Sinocyclocheilus grahami TaxID=75366 RepID=A0A672T2Z9_SINGR
LVTWIILLIYLLRFWTLINNFDAVYLNDSFWLLQYLPPTAVNTTLRLRDLRASMIPLNISAYIIPATDAHLSEYIAPRDARLAWMSGFTGSAGTAVITQNKAVLWTDSRYWIQAERQMDCNWELLRDGEDITNWLILEIPEGDQVGFDPFLFSVGKQTELIKYFM